MFSDKLKTQDNFRVGMKKGLQSDTNTHTHSLQSKEL